MGEIITYEEVMVKKLVCNDPRVRRIWEYGAMAALPTSGEVKRVICILTHASDVPTQFEDKGDGEAVVLAEEFIKSLP